jgi:hypothetical protein
MEDETTQAQQGQSSPPNQESAEAKPKPTPEEAAAFGQRIKNSPLIQALQ